jgi:hypothetical protein
MKRIQLYLPVAIITSVIISGCRGEPIIGDAGADADACGAGEPMITETTALVSDESWLTYGADMGQDAPPGWNTVAFDDRSWTASIAPNPAACGTTYEPTHSWERPNEPMWNVANKYSAYFRKVVTLPANATVTAAKITSFADDDIAIWVNGTPAFIEDNFGVVEGGTIIPNEIDLKPFLVPGANLIAIHGQDTIGFCRWTVVSGSIEVTHVAR